MEKMFEAVARQFVSGISLDDRIVYLATQVRFLPRIAKLANDLEDFATHLRNEDMTVQDCIQLQEAIDDYRCSIMNSNYQSIIPTVCLYHKVLQKLSIGIANCNHVLDMMKMERAISQLKKVVQEDGEDMKYKRLMFIDTMYK